MIGEKEKVASGGGGAIKLGNKERIIKRIIGWINELTNYCQKGE
jgi:hypothetical protein